MNSQVQNLYDIVVFENDLFVSSWSNMSIIKMNKFANGHPEIIASNVSRPFSVIVYHRQRQPEGELDLEEGSVEDEVDSY